MAQRSPRHDLAEAWQTMLTFQEHTTGGGPWPDYHSRWEADWNEAAQYAFSLVGYSNTEQQFRKALDHLAGPVERRCREVTDGLQRPFVASKRPDKGRRLAC